MTLEGKIIQVIGMQEGISKTTGKEWKVATYLLETDGQYPKKVVVEVFGSDRIDEFSLLAGEHVKLEIDVESREFNGKWYTSVRAYKKHEVDAISDADAAAIQAAAPAPQAAPAPATQTVEETDELPF